MMRKLDVYHFDSFNKYFVPVFVCMYVCRLEVHLGCSAGAVQLFIKTGPHIVLKCTKQVKLFGQ